MKSLVVVPCGKTKIWDWHPDAGPVDAEQAYVSGYFKLNRQYALRFGESWVILSAKYGFLWPWEKIENYSVSFLAPTGNEIDVPALIQQARLKNLFHFEKVIGLGGKAYRDRVLSVFGQTIPCEFPFEGLPIGATMQAVRVLLEKA